MVKKVNFFKLVFFLLSSGLFFINSVYAWQCHFLLTYLALKDQPNLQQLSINPESLPTFVEKEKLGLKKLLQENEKWSRLNLHYYAPLPKELFFLNKTNNTPITLQFIESIRVNPNKNFPLFIQLPPLQKFNKFEILEKNQAMLDKLTHSTLISIPNPPLIKLTIQQKVSPLEIIATAVDEPDYGMDLNLWEDTSTTPGKLYKLGKQPFGNNNLLIGSQAPFHMGFYYESFILYKVAPSLKYSYAEYRIHLYLKLARYAFKTGHVYWGYRFLGWSLHYIQDLTQPYHTKLAPNFSTIKILYTALLNKFSNGSIEKNLIQLITNRHLSLENYTFFTIKDNMEHNSKHNLLVEQMSMSNLDKNYPAYSNLYPRMVAKESNEKADLIDKLIRETIPKKYIQDSKYIFYTTEPNINLEKVINYSSNNEVNKLNLVISELLKSLGSHTRNVVRYATTN